MLCWQNKMQNLNQYECIVWFVQLIHQFLELTPVCCLFFSSEQEEIKTTVKKNKISGFICFIVKFECPNIVIIL